MPGRLSARFTDVAQCAREGAHLMKDNDEAALQPRRTQDPRWQERIELAKIAREQGKKAREGKPTMLRMRREAP